MKRSEMVKVIYNYKRVCVPWDDWEFAEGLLEQLELMGMLPPYNENHGIDNFNLAMGQPVSATYNWEPEEEL